MLPSRSGAIQEFVRDIEEALGPVDVFGGRQAGEARPDLIVADGSRFCGFL